MEIAVNIKDKAGRHCGVYALRKLQEGYLWSFVKSENRPNHNLNTIIKSSNARWLRDNNNQFYATYPFYEEDLKESTAWTT